MNLKTVTIADLKPHPDNPNTHPAKQIDALADSLKNKINCKIGDKNDFRRSREIAE